MISAVISTPTPHVCMCFTMPVTCKSIYILAPSFLVSFSSATFPWKNVCRSITQNWPQCWENEVTWSKATNRPVTEPVYTESITVLAGTLLCWHEHRDISSGLEVEALYPSTQCQGVAWSLSPHRHPSSSATGSWSTFQSPRAQHTLMRLSRGLKCFVPYTLTLDNVVFSAVTHMIYGS